MASLLPTIRIAALGTTTFLSLIVLGLAAHVTNLTVGYFGGYFTFAALSIATAILSILSLPVMIIVDTMRKGAFTSLIVVELVWLGILWVLWLASAATASQASLLFSAGCRYRFDVVSETCREFSAIQAFAHLNWLILLSYSGVLFAFSINAANRGVPIWSQSVKSADFNASAPPQAALPAMQQPQSTGFPQVSAPQFAPQFAPQHVGAAPGWTGQPQAPSPAQPTPIQV